MTAGVGEAAAITVNRVPALRERILGAAAELVLADETVTVERIVERAGVGRATFYRHFRNRAEVLSELMIENARAVIDAAIAAAMEFPSTEDRLARATVTAINAQVTHPLLRRVMSGDNAPLAAADMLASAAAAASVRRFLRPLLLAGQAAGEVPADLPLEQAEQWMLRIGLSLLESAPEGGYDEAELSAYLRRFALPGLLARD